MNELISIIVPCYNVSAYVERCINSIIAQTYSNIEIILINDGSTDDTLQKCKQFSQSDKRIVLIDKENGGLSSARNKGLDIAHGNYIVFIDSDDFISEDHVELLYTTLKKYDADVCVSPFCMIHEQEQITNNNSTKELTFSPIEAIETMFYQKLFDSTAHCKIYKKELFDNIRFREPMVYEDLYILPDVLLQSKKVAYISKATYAYVLHDNSIEGSGFSELKHKSFKLIIDKLSNDSRLKPIQQSVDCRLFSFLSRIFFSMPQNNAEKNLVWKQMTAMRKKVIFNQRARIKNRLAALLTFLGAPLCSKIYSAIKTR